MCYPAPNIQADRESVSASTDAVPDGRSRGTLGLPCSPSQSLEKPPRQVLMGLIDEKKTEQRTDAPSTRPHFSECEKWHVERCTGTALDIATAPRRSPFCEKDPSVQPSPRGMRASLRRRSSSSALTGLDERETAELFWKLATTADERACPDCLCGPSHSVPPTSCWQHLMATCAYCWPSCSYGIATVPQFRVHTRLDMPSPDSE